MPAKDVTVLERELEARVAASEANIESLARDVRGLATSVDTMRATVQAALDKITDRFAANQRPNYALWIGVISIAVTVILGIVGIAGSGYVRDQGRLELTLNELVKREIEYAPEIGSRMRQIDNLETRTKDLDETLQREMRLINDTTRKEIDGLRDQTIAMLEALDKRLQTELTNTVASRDRERTQLRSDLDAISRKTDGFEAALVDSVRQRTQNIERIRALERHTYGKEKAETP